MAFSDIEWMTLSPDARAFLMRPSIRGFRTEKESVLLDTDRR